MDGWKWVPVEPLFAASQWREGAPPHPWDKEWFLAGLTDGSYAVLRPLPEDFTYDFTTADETYLMRHKVKRWAQLSDSNYMPPKPEDVSPAGEVEVLGWQVAVEGYKSVQCETAERAEDTSKHYTERGRAVTLVELVDRDHVTRLTAENVWLEDLCNRKQVALTELGLAAIALRIERDTLKAENARLQASNKQAYDAGFDTGFANGKEQGTRDAEKVIVSLQSDLTKVRELLLDVGTSMGSTEGRRAARKKIDAFILTHQSAPAAKPTLVECDASTVQSCDEKGCGFLGAGNGEPAACWTSTNHECPGDGVGSCKKCPNTPAANPIACKVDESCGQDADKESE